ncbi:hypothetical protein HY625_02230 [Candidatus Uhrbacteria bacterium]|nr:hypothetical protein [Candidatus Uhrbacteria bacterium]
MRHIPLRLALVLSAFLLLGAGCIRFTANSGDAGIYLSTDGGGKWEQKVFVGQGKNSAVTIGGELITAMAFVPKNPATIYIGTEGSGVYKTENGGDQWSRFLPFNGRTYALVVNPKNSANVLVALGERVLRTTDGGKNWEISYIETRSKVSIEDLVVDAFDPKKVYLALSNGDLMHSVDGGSSWAILYHTDSAILRILVHPKDTRVITIMTQYHGLYRSTDLGKSWTALRSTLEKYNNALHGQALATNATNADHLLYASAFGILETKDGGKSWNEIKLLASPDTAPVMAFALAPSKPDYFYYATPTTLYRSHDHGKTWTTSPLPSSKRPSVLFVHPQNEKIIYMGIKK